MVPRIVLFLTILLSLSFAQTFSLLNKSQGVNTDDSQFTDKGEALCGTVLLTNEVLQKAIENTRSANPRIYASMLNSTQKAELLKAQYAVGDIESFFVYNFINDGYDVVICKLKAIGSVSQVWVDTTELSNEHITQTEIDAILTSLEDETPAASRNPQEGIVKLDQQYFGDPPDYDNDQKTDFLVTDIKDGWQPGEGYIAGFFSSWDQTSNTGSNQRDLLYIDSYPGIYYNGSRNPSQPLSTLAHELQHLIHYRYDRYETTFFNEGLSEIAEVICGYPLRSPAGYLSDTDIPLLDWDNLSSSVLNDYSRAALFALYYDEQLGDPFLKKLVSEPKHGIPGFQQTIDNEGLGITFENLFTNWTMANYLNDPAIDAAYGYSYPLTMLPTAAANYSEPNQNISDETVQPYAVDYIVYSYGQSLQIEFESASPVSIMAFKFGDDGTTMEKVLLSAPYSVPEFGSSVDRIVFAVVNPNSFAGTYSYSSTGTQQDFYVEQKYDDGVPDDFGGGATYLGFGSNSQGYGWAVKFAPEIPQNQLISAQILAAFDQEFQGSEVPADAPKDFIFHVWDNNNGLPGNDLLPPFTVSTDRPSNTGAFLNIDLSAYQQELTGLDTVYLGFIDNDTLGTYVGMDNSASENYTFAFFVPDSKPPDRWFPLSDLSVGGVNLAGFNMMMRAVFSYADTTTPRFYLGYFQNPVFTENLDLFIAGSSRLSADRLTSILIQGTDKDTLELIPLPNSNEAILTNNKITLKESGPTDVQIQGKTKYGMIYADTTISFNAVLINAAAGGTVADLQNNLVVDFPAASLAKNSYIITFKGNSDLTNKEIEHSQAEEYSPVFTVSPVGLELQTPAKIRIKIQPETLSSVNPEELAIACWDTDHWTPVNSSIITADDYVEAEVNRLGHFVLIRKGTASDISEISGNMPKKFQLYQNFPNPFNPATDIRFDIPEKSHVSIKIFDILGRKVRTLVNSIKPAGSYRISWDGRGKNGAQVGSGIYICHIKTHAFTKSIKMLLAK